MAAGPRQGQVKENLIKGSPLKDLTPVLAQLLTWSEQYDRKAQWAGAQADLSQQGFSVDFCAVAPRQVKPDPTPLLSSRHNVFQNDEFDVFSRDSVDLSRVHKGRR